MKLSDRAAYGLRQSIAAYLQGFGFSGQPQVDTLGPRLIGRVMESAADADTIAAAMDCRVVEWFGTILEIGGADPERVLILWRAAFLLSDAAMRWPDAFLREGPAPADMVAALRAAVPVATPPERPIDMVAQPLPLPSFARFVPRLRKLAPAGTSDSER